MAGIFFIIVGLLSITISFWSLFWSWLIFGTAESIIISIFFGVKSKKWKYIPELSDEANVLFQKYGHFYTMPFAARDFSSSASGYELMSIVLAVICGFKGAWWCIAVAIANIAIMGFIARNFNPTPFITDPLERIAHAEVIDYMNSYHER
jgi:hypothetical protein